MMVARDSTTPKEEDGADKEEKWHRQHLQQQGNQSHLADQE